MRLWRTLVHPDQKTTSSLDSEKKKIPSLNCPSSGMLFMCFYRFGVHELFQSERERKRERIATPDQALSDLAGA